MSPRNCASRAGGPCHSPQVVDSVVAALDRHTTPPTGGIDDIDDIDNIAGRADKQNLMSSKIHSEGDPDSLTTVAGNEKEKPRKSVRWSTITIHEFGVGLGGSAVSTKGGPSIGLAATPEFTWTTKVGEIAECSEGVHRFSPNQRIRLLQAAGIPDGIITRHARETNIILGSRRRSKTAWEEESDSEESEEEEEECMEPSRKRRADQVALEGPCSFYLRRPRMIPANYV